MFDLEPHEAEMDRFLRQSLAGPVPQLSPDFHQALSRKLRRASQPLSQFGRILLSGYGGLSAVISVVVMRQQGLGWMATTLMILGCLATLELTRQLRQRQWGTADDRH